MKGVGRIYQQTFIDTYAKVAFAKLYDRKTPITAAEILNDRVLPFFEEHGIVLCRVLTDRGTEYCGKPPTPARTSSPRPFMPSSHTLVIARKAPCSMKSACSATRSARCRSSSTCSDRWRSICASLRPSSNGSFPISSSPSRRSSSNTHPAASMTGT